MFEFCNFARFRSRIRSDEYVESVDEILFEHKRKTFNSIAADPNARAVITIMYGRFSRQFMSESQTHSVNQNRLNGGGGKTISNHLAIIVKRLRFTGRKRYSNGNNLLAIPLYRLAGGNSNFQRSTDRVTHQFYPRNSSRYLNYQFELIYFVFCVSHSSFGRAARNEQLANGNLNTFHNEKKNNHTGY